MDCVDWANDDRLEHYRWLLGRQGAMWLVRLADVRRVSASLVDRLRRELPAERVHLLLEQVELRRRAKNKFAAAERMYFTRKGLEQASGELVAQYKAGRFPCGRPVADLCCGIGGDLLALARRGPVLGVELDPVAALLAEANLQVSDTPAAKGQHAGVRVADTRRLRQAGIDLGQFAAWHIDPDRRPAGRRTTRPELYRPPLETIQALLQGQPNAAVKLAPAAGVPAHWEQEAELEWIGHGGECRQLVAWFGQLARHPGRRCATVLQRDRENGRLHWQTVAGTLSAKPAAVTGPLRYLFDPDPAVLAAGLLPQVAQQFGLTTLGPVGGYLTGDEPVEHMALACFEVLDVLPFDLARLRSWLRERQIGHLEIKKRAVAENVDQLRRKLRLRGTRRAVLILARTESRVLAVLARRALPRRDQVGSYSPE